MAVLVIAPCYALFDDTLFTFYKQVNYINEKLNLNIIIDDDYIFPL